MQFIVTGKDGSDPLAHTRRQSARAAHLENVARMKTSGNLLFAAAICDETGNMTGSVMVVDFPSRAELDAWLKKEPYVVQKVWHSVEVSPCVVPGMFL